MKRVVFVNPSNNTQKRNNFSNGLFSLATILKKEGYYVRVIDLDFLFSNHLLKRSEDRDEQLELVSEYILNEKPDIIDFYTMSNSYYFTIKLSQIIKKKNKRVKILFGGPQATLSFKETLVNFTWVDGIGLGEGEKTISNIIRTLANNEKFSNEKGIAYLNNGAVISNDIELIKNLDELEAYDFSILEGEISDKISLDVGRGCPFGCKYCSTKTFWKRSFRLKSTERIIEEISYAKDNFNISTFNFEHDLFTANKIKVIDFCNKVIDRNLNIKWTCSSRADTLDAAVIEIMREAGCVGVYLGIETGSSRMQKIINKNLNLEKVRETVKILKRNNIKVVSSFIYGFPEEHEEDLDNTLGLIYDLVNIGIDIVQLHLFSVFPGTEYMEELEEYLYLSNTFSDAAFTKAISNEERIFIENNKKIFPQYLDFSIGIRNELKFLDVYAYRYLRRIIKYFRKTYDILINIIGSHIEFFKVFRKTYDILINIIGSHIEFFKVFRKINNEELKKCENWDENIGVTPSDVISSIEKIIISMNVKNNDILNEVFKFESDIVKFMYYSADKVSSVEYKYDVYSIKKSTLTDFNKFNYINKTNIQYTRLDQKYNINIKKICEGGI